MNSPENTAYLQPSCGWIGGLRAIMRKYNLANEDRDVIHSRSIHEQTVQKSGRRLAPHVSRQCQMQAIVGVITSLPKHRILNMLEALCTHQRLRHLLFGRACFHARIVKSSDFKTHQH